MRKLTLPCLFLAGAVLSGVIASAEGNQCIDMDAHPACVHIGKLNQLIVLTDTFESCSTKTLSAQKSSTYDHESSVIYQFEIVGGHSVAFTVGGLGDTILLRDGNVVFEGSEELTAFSRRFEPGQYTLIGRAPLCEYGKDDWEGTFTIRFHPNADVIWNQRLRAERVNADTLTHSENEEPLESRVTKWLLGGAISGAVAFLLFGLLLFAIGGGA